MIENIRIICAQEWFFGDISTQDAVEELTGRPAGTFLVRFSESVPGCYTLSQVKEGRRILHQRIKHTPGGPYIYEKANYDSLPDLIQKCGHNKPCMSHVYKRIFEIVDDEVPEYLFDDNQ